MVVCRCGFKTFNLALPRAKGAESNVLSVRAEAPDSPSSVLQFTPPRWSSLGGHRWGSLGGHRGSVAAQSDRAVASSAHLMIPSPFLTLIRINVFKEAVVVGAIQHLPSLAAKHSNRTWVRIRQSKVEYLRVAQWTWGFIAPPPEGLRGRNVEHHRAAFDLVREMPACH
jgi:hypothetical protein